MFIKTPLKNSVFIFFFALSLVALTALYVHAKSFTQAPQQPVIVRNNNVMPYKFGPTAAVTYIKRVNNQDVLFRAIVSPTGPVQIDSVRYLGSLSEHAMVKNGNDMDIAYFTPGTPWSPIVIDYIKIFNNNVNTMITEPIPLNLVQGETVQSIQITLGEYNGAKVPVVAVMTNHPVLLARIYLAIRTAQGWSTGMVVNGAGVDLYAKRFDIKTENTGGNTTKVFVIFQKVNANNPIPLTQVFRAEISIGTVPNPVTWSSGPLVNISAPLNGQPLAGGGFLTSQRVCVGAENMAFTTDTDVAYYMTLLNGTWTQPVPFPIAPTSTVNVVEDFIEDIGIFPWMMVLTKEQFQKIKLEIILGGTWVAAFPIATANQGNGFSWASLQDEYSTAGGFPISEFFIATVQEGGAAPILEVHYMKASQFGAPQIITTAVDTAGFGGLSQVHVVRMW